MENIHFNSNENIQKITNGVQRIKEQLNKVIIGQDQFTDQLLISILSNGHSLIEGVPGVAKTITAKLLAKCIGGDFSRIQFTPDLMPSDVLGTSIFNPKKNEFEFKKGPIFGNIILIDEINRAPAKTQSALFESMAERQISIDGITYVMENPFLVFATQNPIEQEGTYRLPEAQLDRFLFKILVDYPSLEHEEKILFTLGNMSQKDMISQVEPVFTAQEITQLQEIVNQVKVEENLIKYIAKVIVSSRNNPFLFLGASPRASIAILQASKANAAIRGRDFVIPEDIKTVAVPVLRHRIIVTPEKEMEGIDAEQVTQQILESTEIPL